MSDTQFLQQAINLAMENVRAAGGLLAQLLSVMGKSLRVALIKCLSSMTQPPMRS